MRRALATYLAHHPTVALGVWTFVLLTFAIGVLHEFALLLSVLRVFVRAAKQHLAHVATEGRALWDDLTTWDDRR